MKKIAIFGAGGFGREVKTIIDAINKINPTYEFIGYYDDSIAKDTMVNNHLVLGAIDELNQLSEDLCLAIAVGDPATKRKIITQISSEKITYPNIIHPSVQISEDYVDLGKGNIICGGTIITCNIQIKDFVILNLMCTVGHDSSIDSYASFMPSVNISGEAVIKEGVYVGTGAKIINQIEIGEYTIIGAGAVVAKSLPAYCTAVGIPAKPIKFHN